MNIIKKSISAFLTLAITLSVMGVFASNAKAETQNTIKYVEVYLDFSPDETSKNIRNRLQNVFDEARDNGKPYAQYKIILPKNMVLKISSTISIYSNTYLDMNGSTILRDYSTNSVLFKAGRNEAYNGYDGYGNITIANGTIDGWDNLQTPSEGNLLRFGHSKNILLENLTFVDNCNTHFLEIGASKDVTVKNCTFKNQNLVNGKTEASEAVQIDALSKDGFVLYDYYDGTSCNNINFINCDFNNVTRGIGSHAVILGDTGIYKNINITGCTFNNLSDYAIVSLCWVNCNIKNNTMNNCENGIYLRTMRSDFSRMYDGDFSKPITNYNTVIYNNTINAKHNAIKTYGVKLNYAVKWTYNSDSTGTIPAGDYVLSNLKVNKNNITCKDTAITFLHTKSSYITNNTIKLNTGSSSKVGVYLTDNSYNNKISNNTITNANSSAIKSGVLLSNSQNNNTITGNTINGKFKNGIYLYNGANNSTVSNNTIKNTSENGIYNYGSKNLKINSNTISPDYGNSIALGGNASASTISNNTISNGKTGILIKDSNGGSITKNKSQNNSYGIYSSNGQGKIYTNTLKNSSYGIYLEYNADMRVYTNSFSGNKKGNILLEDNKDIITSNLKATSKLKSQATAYNKIKLSWEKPRKGAYHRIYKSTDNKNFTYIDYTNENSTSYTDKNLTPYKNYYYYVVPVISNGKSYVVGTDSPVKTAKTTVRASTLSYAKKSGKDKVKLMWKKDFTPESYRVYRKETGEKSFKLIRTIKGTSKGCYDPTVKPKKKYLYKVCQICHNGKKKIITGKFSNIKIVNT